MEITWTQAFKEKKQFYTWASALALIAIFYNVIEGYVSVFLGRQDETIALLGFGLYSFVEVVSGIGIWHMVRRMRHNDIADHDVFEKRALQITGGAFYVLAVGLIITSAVNIYTGNRPETTFWGIIVSMLSICFMWMLIQYKVKLGRQYNSRALLSDANCSMVCIYISIILLVSSLGYEVIGIGWLDSIGGMGIAVFSFREGSEAFRKSKGNL
jgi:divalent metal cation (Fe/Co/Zn/Cd) transporter